MSFRIANGTPIPSGVHIHDGGINFSLFSRHATRVWLHLYADPSDTRPCLTISLDPLHHRTGDIWHVCVHGARPGMAYLYQVDGPYDPAKGHRFDPSKLLIDPCATALVGTDHWDFAAASGYGGNSSMAIPDATVKCLIATDGFDWNGDRPPRHPWSDLVIYEMHVRGFTVHPTSGVRYPGTYLGVIEKIPYLKELGVTAVELMPLQEFNPRELTRVNPYSGETLVNYWGYNTAAFFAPTEQFGSKTYPGCQIQEFKAMVKALHAAGIEVLLDVVFNHSAEGDHTGPTLNYKGLDNSIYYLLEEDKSRYKNFSGCGNTLNCNHPVTRRFILDCLRYWVIEMRVDGFRFDLASILGRDKDGHLVSNPPLLEIISEDPILRGVKLIAEAWDAGGAYQVGRFHCERWSEWNGHYRDDVRRFWRGDAGTLGLFASRLCGSEDLYRGGGKAPINSVNFVTCHDGFTLADLVSYSRKHNLANGEENRDGMDENYSDNFGAEGETGDPTIKANRLRQMKNFIATLLLSRGVPMLLAGDEFARTQQGNNNAYCQDNLVSWFDWNLLGQNRELFEFAKSMIALRKRHPVLSNASFYQPEEITWFGVDGQHPNWEHDSVFGCVLHPGPHHKAELCLLFNPSWEGKEFRLPSPWCDIRWHLVVDTSAPAATESHQRGSEFSAVRNGALSIGHHGLILLESG